MDRKKLIKTLIYLVFFILIINFFANKLYWYYAIWWFDMPMHFLGGLWVGLLAFYFLSFQSLSFQTTCKVLLFVLFVGVGWEIFEILVNDVITQNPFNYLDTISDIFFDLSGGTIAILYFFKRIMLQSKHGL